MPGIQKETPEERLDKALAAIEGLSAEIKKLKRRPDPVTGNRPQLIPNQDALLKKLGLTDEDLPKEGKPYCWPRKKGKGLIMLETKGGSVMQFVSQVRINTLYDPRTEDNTGQKLIHKNISFTCVFNYLDNKTGNIEWSPNVSELPIEKWAEWKKAGIRLYEPDEEENNK